MSQSSTQEKITIDKAEFVRTRDAIVTSWTRLHASLQNAIQAYIEHSNAVLAGEDALTHSGLNVLVDLANTSLPAAAPAIPKLSTEESTVKDETVAAPGKKTRAKKIKDPNAPKRPVTGYLQFLASVRPEIQAELAARTQSDEVQKRGDISVEGTARWKALSDAERDHWREVYKTKYAEWQKRMAAYQSGDPEAVPAEIDPPSDLDGVPSTPAPPPKKAPKASKAHPALKPVAPPAPEEDDDDDDDDDDSSVVSSSSEEPPSDDTDDEQPAPAPPPPVTAKVTKTPTAKKAKDAPAAPSATAAVDASAAALASKQKKAKKDAPSATTSVPAPATSTAAPAEASAAPTSSPIKKRKSAEKDGKDKVVKKRKSAVNGDAVPASSPAPTATPAVPAATPAAHLETDKKEKKRKRKSAGLPAAVDSS